MSQEEALSKESNYLKMVESQKRQVAYKVSIRDISEGSYVKQEGWKPNYILTKNDKKVSRINLLATIISIDSTSPAQINITVDDGTGSISIRSFEESNIAKDLEIGDIISIIGRPREFGSTKYLVPEVIKKVKDIRWIEVRKKQVQLYKLRNNIHEKLESTREKKPSEKSEEATSEPEETEEETIISEGVNSKQTVYQTIKSLDKGDGVDIEDVISRSKIDNCEDVVNMLLMEGEVFEIKKGRLKILE